MSAGEGAKLFFYGAQNCLKSRQHHFMRLFYGLRFFLGASRGYHPVLPFLDFSVLPRKNPQINQGFLSAAEPTKTLEKKERKNTNNQGNSLLKSNQGILKNQGKEGQGIAPNNITDRTCNFRELIPTPTKRDRNVILKELRMCA